MKVWLNDGLMEIEEASVSVTDRGFTLGDGLFETMSVRAGEVPRLEAHLERLARGIKLLALPPVGEKEIVSALDDVLQANGLTDAMVRLTISRGPAPRGLLPPKDQRPTLLITATPPPGPMPPVRAVVAKTTRRNEHSPLSRCKCLNYLDNILARMEAEERGGNEAILLNTAGDLAETTIANLFLVLDGALVTPRIEDGALPGTMRGEILKGLNGEERRLTLEDLEQAEEAFITNSTGVRSLLTVDGKPVGSGEIGPIAASLLSL